MHAVASTEYIRERVCAWQAWALSIINQSVIFLTTGFKFPGEDRTNLTLKFQVLS